MLERIVTALTSNCSRSALAALLLWALSPVVMAVSPNIVISQIHGGGGNSGATYKNDFIELFNRGSTTINVTGWSVQYAASGGTSWQATSLTGSIPPGGYFLVQQAAGTGTQPNLPTPDATGTIAMSGTGGKVALVNSTTLLTGSGCPFGSSVVDYVAYGTGANCFEGTGGTPAPSNTVGVTRALAGCTDTDSNSSDFSTAAVNPRNSSTPVNLCNSLPNLTINDVTAAEGNSGTTTFTFTVSLSAPAGAGGVTFDISTANGTATAGSDYVAKTLTGQTIPQGISNYTFTVDVNGDTTPETNETFFVNITNLVGANPTDVQGLGTITNDDAAPNLTINNVSQNEGDSGTTTFTFTVSLSAPAPAGGVTFDIATADGTATAPSDYATKSLTSQTIAEGATTYTFDVLVNGDTTGEQNETFAVTITNLVGAIPVTLTGTGTILNDDAQRIHTVQGSGNTSPFAGQVVTIEGIVTSNQQGPGTLQGFFIQEPDNLADADPLTSEGMFVFTAATPASVNIGDLVRVTGTVFEYLNGTGAVAPNSLTEITSPTSITVLSSGNPLPVFVTVTLPVTNVGDLERYENMRVRIQQSLTVSQVENLAQYGEILVTAGGRALTATETIDPNDNPASGNSSSGSSNVAAVLAYENLNVRSSVIIDGAGGTYPSVIPFLDPSTNTLRVGTTLSDVTGILSQLAGAHRIYPDVAPVFTYAPRPMTPPNVGGNVKIASANVLNYFNGDGLGGGFPTSRGADTLAEFNRQRAKVIAAITGLGADVVGLLEIEKDDNGPNSALQDLVNGLNAVSGSGTWSFVDDSALYCCGNLGTTDVIRPAIIYKSAVVIPDGAATALFDTAFSQARAPLAQTFKLVANNEKFALVINHFKSKGSGSGADADQGDGQGASNSSRRAQAQALVGFINALAAATPRIIAMGDFNAYGEEDPLDIFRAAGLSSLAAGDTSYVFQGRSGSLDHAFANAALASTVTGAGHWHINADEPEFIDYNKENKVGCPGVTPCTSPDLYAADPFRASDHDPVLIGLQLNAAVVQCLAGTYSATGNAPCTPASPGNFAPMAGATSQTACLAGTYQPNSAATSCLSADAGSFATGPGATTQTACAAGSFSSASGAAACTPASPGNFVGMSGATGQTQCLAGSFQANSGASSCDPAAAGNFVATPGSSTQSQCAAGFYQPNTGSTSCLTADAGSFATGPGATAQTACLAGSYSSASGASSCTPASAGNFVATPGATTQTACTAGSYSGMSGASTCTPASPGFFVPMSGASTQTVCPNGSTSLVSGATACIPLFTVTPSANTGGSITPAAPQSVAQGQTTSFTLAADAGYSVGGVTGTCGGTLVGNTYTTAAVSADCTVIASFTFIPVVPDAPIAVSAVAGDASALVSFSPPMFNGGATITSYTATCGTQSASGSGSPLNVTGLTNLVSVNCSVTATNSVGTSAPSASVSVTPQPALTLVSALSHKIHDSAGPFNLGIDITAPIGGAVTVEPRAIGAGHTVIMQFNVPITIAGTATVVDASSAPAGTATTSAIANQVTVTLTGVADNKRVTVLLSGINGSGSASVSIGFLLGDTNNSRSVDATDVSAVRARAGQPVDGGNFQFDLNASGVITAADIAAVKARSGTTLP